MRPRARLAVLCLAALAAVAAPAHAAPTYVLLRDATMRVYPKLGNGGGTAVSADGRWVAFIAFVSYTGDAQSLLQGGAGLPQVALHDRVTHRTVVVTRRSATEYGNAASQDVSMSADGRYVLFTSAASNLPAVPADKNGVADVFLYDRVTKRLTRPNVDATGGREVGGGDRAVLSRDGSAVAYVGSGKPLGPKGPADQSGLYVWYRAKRRLVPVTRPDGTLTKIGSGSLPSISGDGRRVGMQALNDAFYQVYEVATRKTWNVPDGVAGALDLRGQRVVVTTTTGMFNGTNGGFAIADLASGKVTSGETAAPGVRAWRVAMSDDGRTAVVTGWSNTDGTTAARNGVLLVDTATAAVTSLGVLAGPSCAARSCVYGGMTPAAVGAGRVVAFGTDQPLGAGDSGDDSDLYLVTA
jgi:hypothetical protein